MRAVALAFLALVASDSVAPDDMIIVGGQSLSEGLSSGGILSSTQPYCNQMVSTINYNSTTFGMQVDAAAFPLTPLVEIAANESPRSGMANYISSVDGSCALVITDSQGGTAYAGLAPGTVPWTFFKKNVESGGARSARKLRFRYDVEGEADHEIGTSVNGFITALFDRQLNTTLEAWASSATTLQVPLFIDQLSTWTATLITCIGPGTCPPAGQTFIAQAQYLASRMAPSYIVLVNSTYQLVTGGDGVHRTSAAYRQEGATAGEASLDGFDSLGGSRHQPLWPTCVEFPNACTTSPITRTGAVIHLSLYVPNGPIVFNTSLITGVPAASKGFEYVDSAGAGTINSVTCAVVSGHTYNCDITLSADPTGHTAKKLGYAFTGTPNTHGGPTTGPRGTLCDSTSATWQGATLEYCLVVFQEDVP